MGGSIDQTHFVLMIQQIHLSVFSLLECANSVFTIFWADVLRSKIEELLRLDVLYGKTTC